MAYAMVTFYGMSDKMPNISYYDSSGQEYGFTKPYSETRAQTIDAEVQSIIDSQYERARQILLQYVEGHHQLAELLLEREVIYTEDAERIFGKRQWLSRTEEIMRASEKEKEEKEQEQEQEVQADDNTSVTPPPFIRKD